MENNKIRTVKDGRLEKLLLISWYVTVASAAFTDCLLRFKLPIGGHFFLFRGAVLFTCLVYLLVLLLRRKNPLCGLSRIELCFVVTAACMLAYGVISAAWSLGLGAWFSRLFTMGQMFALVFLFLKLCRDETVMRVTLALNGTTIFFCGLGGLVECFHGPFFDTPYRDLGYVFFGRPMYAPIFTFYNTNGLAVYLVFTLELLFLYMAFNWERNRPVRSRRLLYILTACACLTLFLCCAGGGRLAFLSLSIILFSVAVWLAIRYRKGLIVFALSAALTFAFVYVGENFQEIQYGVIQRWEQVAGFPSAPSTPDDSSEQPPASEPPKKNPSGTLQTIVPTITGNYENESLQQSDNVRLALLKNSWKMLVESKGMGIGAGNAELRMADFDNTGGLTNVHCFIMEVLLEFGVFALLPLLVLLFMIFKTLVLCLYEAVKARRWELLSDILLLLLTTVAFPLLSTANSGSWGIAAMWLYVALVLLYSGRMERRRGEERA